MSPLTIEPPVDGRQMIFAATVIFLASLCIRLVHYRQSLWCDEMSTLLDYIFAPWQTIVAAGPGQYVPNDHVLFTLLAKLCLHLGGASEGLPVSANAATLIRLPSLFSGSLVPVALAWPLRYRTPLLAMLVAVFAAVNPWLIAFSDEARGYALMILLGIVATNLLPDGGRRWAVAYSFVIAAMLYTVPVAGMLLIAHGVVVLILRRSAWFAWFRGAVMGGMIALLLYLPMYRGILFYYQHPLITPDNYADFVNQLPRFAAAGQYMPASIDPLTNIPDPNAGILFWWVPVAILVVGSVLSLGETALKQPMTIMAAATILFLIAAFFMPGAGQVRLVPWCGIWLILASAAIAWRLRVYVGTFAMLATVLIASGWFAYCDFTLLPSQPIREAIRLADADAETRPIVVAFLTAAESVKLYGEQSTRHSLIAAPSPPEFLRAEQAVIKQTGRRPSLIVSYEYLVHNFSPSVWDYIQSNYRVEQRLPGRISPVAIYVPR